MGTVIEIRMSEQLPTESQNKLRVKMHRALWKEQWRQAELTKDYEMMEWLERQYNFVGLP